MIGPGMMPGGFDALAGGMGSVQGEMSPPMMEPEAGISGAAETPEPDVISKNDIEGWKGGMKIKLSRRMKSGKTLREELASHLSEILGVEIKNHEERIKKLRQWDKQYRGRRDPKSFPHQYAANTAPPITRSLTDVIMVRLYDSLFNKRKHFILKAVDATYVDAAQQMEDALDWYSRNIIKLQDKMLSPLLECVKYGTGIVKIVYESKKRPIYRYAKSEELYNPDIKKYALDGTESKAVKVVETVYEGPNVYPVPLEDFIITAGATSTQDAYMVGFRKYLRKDEIKRKAAQGIYETGAADKVTGDAKVDENKEGRAENSGLALKKTEYTGLHPLWELWLSYDVDEDGDEDDVVVVFNLENAEILSAIYSPVFGGFRPLFPIRFYPVENSFYGEGACEVLEKLQEEIDTQHNQRIDLLTLAIAPPVFAKANVGLEDGKYIVPGKIKVLEDELDSSYAYGPQPHIPPSSTAEEDRLIAYAERALGVSQANQGISTAERPVAKDTLALLEETNKKHLFSSKVARGDFANVGRGLLDTMAQYMPHVVYRTGPLAQEKAIDIDPATLRDGVMVELEASNETMSQEVRREIRLTEYQMMSDYMTKVAGMAQAFTSPEVPSDMKKAIVEANRVSVELLTRIIRDYDERDPENLVYNPFKEGIIDIQANIQRSVDLLPPPGQVPPEGAGQGGEGGPPPEGGGQNVPPLSGPPPEQMEQMGAM